MIVRTVATEQSLFTHIEDEVLLSCHLLGKPTSAALYRLHHRHVSTDRQMRTIMRRLSTGSNRMLTSIKPMDIDQPIRSLPHIYLDTRLSRRHVEQMFGVPYRRVPPTPSRDWRFLRHDVELADELVSFELTAHKHGIPFGYQPHITDDGSLYPIVPIAWDGISAELRPAPDRTLIVGDYHIILEKDLGTETIECGNILRDASVGRKHLVYDELIRSGHLKSNGPRNTIVAFTIDSLRQKQTASRKRVKRCLEAIPAHVDHSRMFFTDRQSFMQVGDDISELPFIRGDGKVMPLPCWA